MEQWINDIFHLTGLDPQLWPQLRQNYGIESEKDFRSLIKKGIWQYIPKGGGKSGQGQIKRLLRLIEPIDGFLAFHAASFYAEQLIFQLKDLPQILNIEVTGSLGKGEVWHSDIDLLISCDEKVENIINVITHLPQISGIIRREPGRAIFLHYRNFPIDIHFCPPGPEQLRKPLVLPWDLYSLKGDLHTHTDWSEGVHSLEEMALAAKEIGYEYLAICDHSWIHASAGGLSPKRLKEQIEAIRKLNDRLPGITLLAGSEVDITESGGLAYEENLLKELDIVIASVHYLYGQNCHELTERIIKALETGMVDVLAHPTHQTVFSNTNNLHLDMERVFKAASSVGTVMEINSFPDRNDLSADLVIRAKRYGLKMAINTDAHAREQLIFSRTGRAIALKAQLEEGDIINTLSLADLQDFLKNRGKMV
ncbi:PHP domain-containing protein [Moorella sulfitireducens (nom. illeg.)]|uniref:PHP domain-containing protein n=1 Tax=Neomoorella sulfitireducens TaxID=2972948 RepID=UPI0021AC8D0E|nr:PHP domain-containing protein [Moorella sulfitireducens]